MQTFLVVAVVVLVCAIIMGIVVLARWLHVISSLTAMKTISADLATLAEDLHKRVEEDR